ncbi:MAG: MBL fold metallo-hydrolase [Bdellovibrionota bacterium]
MNIRVLGSGTSTGVPVPGCTCAVCTSHDPLNKRLRTSVFVEIQPTDVPSRRAIDPTIEPSETSRVAGGILIDTSPDLRYQALRASIAKIDAVLYTHVHADHVFGIDDLRSFNFINQSVIPVYASEESAAELEHRFSYAFFPDPRYEGAAPPQLTLTRMRPFEPIRLFGIEILPLPVRHGKMEVFGFRIGDFAYLTDCSFIPDETRARLEGLEVLILDGLRYRPHKTHFSHEQAVREIERIAPKRSYLTHVSHEVEHHSANENLRKLTSLAVELAYDGLEINLSC